MAKTKRPCLLIPSRTVYHHWRGGIKGTGYECELTFEEWRDMWLASGLWEQRGKTLGSVCMRREDTELPYSVDNCSIQPIKNKHHNNGSKRN